jgi:hypothetical protein
MSVNGNIRGSKHSSTSGFKTLGSSIAHGNHRGSFKRIYSNAYQRLGGNSDLALSSTLGILRGMYSCINSNNSFYNQQPQLSGRNFTLSSSPLSTNLTQVLQNTNCSQTCPPLTLGGQSWQCSCISTFCSKKTQGECVVKPQKK